MADNDLTAEQETDSELVKRLRAEIRERNTLIADREAALTTVQKQNAFRQAGINPDDGIGKLLFQTYEGDFDKTAVIEAAQQYGISPEGSLPEQTNEAEVERERQQQVEAAAHQQIDNAVGAPSDKGNADPTSVAQEAFATAMGTTGNTEKASVAYFDAKLAAAVQEAKAKR